MARDRLSEKINELFHRCKWEAARKLLEAERDKNPDDHWVLTQLGVTFYEQRRYEEALQLFLESLKIVPDCPLTLWNLAGTLDALGKTTQAIHIYTWLLESNVSPEQDACWESKEWAEALKADCVYRLGVCFRHQGKKQKAEHCFRQYLNLLLAGIDGSYSTEDVMREIRGLHDTGKNGGAASELRKVVSSTLQASGIEPKKGRRKTQPEFNVGKLLTSRRMATKQ
jgi:hypothetical protein